MNDSITTHNVKLNQLYFYIFVYGWRFTLKLILFKHSLLLFSLIFFILSLTTLINYAVNDSSKSLFKPSKIKAHTNVTTTQTSSTDLKNSSLIKLKLILLKNTGLNTLIALNQWQLSWKNLPVHGKNYQLLAKLFCHA